MHILIPRYLDGNQRLAEPRVPPSPPSEARARAFAQKIAALRTYRGTLPPIVEPDRPRTPILLPGDPCYYETLRRAVCMPAGAVMVMGNSPSNSNTRADAAAYWKLANLTDATGNGNTLTNNNTVTFVAGKLGNAAQFSAASSQWLSITDNGFVSGGAGDFTIRTWARFTASASFNTVLAKRTDGDEEYQLRIDNDNKPRWVVWNPSFVTGTAVWSSSITVNNWHWILVDYDSAAGTVGITVDGGTRQTASLASGMRNGTSPFTIGRTRTTDYFTGQIDDTGIWKRLFTSTEKTDDYNGGSGSDPYA